MHHEDAIPHATAAPQPLFDFTGEWTNALGSTMSIVEEAGVLIGVFSSAAGPDDTATSGQLSGQAQGDLVAVTVKWPTAAITAWVGRHRQEPDKDIIEALWQMTATGDKAQGGTWHSIFSGADRFERARDRTVETGPDDLAAEVTVDAGLARSGSF